MPFPLVQIDAFTAAPFAGNPAAVCLLDAPREAAWMQRVAQEMNLSETAFVRLDTAPGAPGQAPEADGAAFDLRWFTPTHEVDLCGHATLAAAHALWTEGYADPAAPLAFATASGRLTARREAPGDDASGNASGGAEATGDAGWITLDFPADPPVSAEAPPALLGALGLRAAAYVGRTGRDLFVQVDAPAVVRTLAPDLARLATLDARGVIVTAAATTDDDAAATDAEGADLAGADLAGADLAGADFVSRFFAPAVGVPEDPVTGSAHCALAPFWAERLGRAQLVGRQLSARGGTVRVHARGARVTLGGQAVTVLRGTLAA
jgi:predicted PhzF superfamily epimerase YddE/YHI9